VTATSLRSVRGLRLERLFAELGPRAQHLLCTSDIEPFRLPELLELADPETRELWARLDLGYTEPDGMLALRREIAATYAGVEPDHVATFAGADEAIFLALNAILGPGDHAVVTWPAYQSLHEVARAAGADVTLVPLDPAEGWALDAEAIRRAIRPSTRVVIVNFPTTPPARWRAVRPSTRSRRSRRRPASPNAFDITPMLTARPPYSTAAGRRSPGSCSSWR